MNHRPAPFPARGSLLGPEDAPPVAVINPDGKAQVLLFADHAGRAIPRRLGRLGLDRASLDLHIAFDIGARLVAERLAERLGAPAVLGGYSRLVIDCNRPVGHETSIPEVSDGIRIPGNAGLEAADARARDEAIHRPYHDTIAAWVSRLLGAGRPPAVISVHSFTPVMRGFRRPWHVGILWNRDPRLAVPLLRQLAATPSVAVGDNVPYSGTDEFGFSIPFHAERHGLAHVQLEVRQDLIAEAAGARHWADVIADALAAPLADPGLYRLSRY
ncbi:MAG: N-formylglutamate amidohydrolase [Alphaproteobacteria bacterium]|nr:N-formylglutamate amidohydrolase [Alphaproteobacteria bacterium]